VIPVTCKISCTMIEQLQAMNANESA